MIQLLSTMRKVGRGELEELLCIMNQFQVQLIPVIMRPQLILMLF